MEIARAACAEKTQEIFDRSPFGVFRRGIFQSEHSIIKYFLQGSFYLVRALATRKSFYLAQVMLARKSFYFA